MRILVYADNASWLKQLRGLADKLEAEARALVFDGNLVEEASRLFSRVYYSSLQAFNPLQAARVAAKALERCNPDIMAAPCTNKGRIVAGLFSALSGGLPVSDVISVEAEGEELRVKRLVFGGTASASLRVNVPAVLCVSPGVMPEATYRGSIGVVEELKAESAGGIEVEFKAREAIGVEPDKADVVVVAGRGVKRREDLSMIRELAELLGGVWSVTRPLAADYGWSDTWIGISGLSIAPRLYIGVGVSGQPHHMMGVRGAKIIVAVNKDPNAPIFNEADYGIIGDLYKVLPVLIRRLKERGA